VAYRPAASIASYVEHFWYCEGYQMPHRRERVLPNGRFQLIINLSDSFASEGQISPSPLVVGMQSRGTMIDTASLQSIAGVLFWPGAAPAFFDPPADEFHNRNIPLDLVWGPAAGELRERLRGAPTPASKFAVLEAALQARAGKRGGLHSAVRYAIGKIERAPHIRSVLELARDAGLSRRRFAQLFREQVGVTPKLYCRLHRFREVVRQIDSGAPVDWADVALAGGYCDQAHLAHEFREFAGISPGACLAGKRPFFNHVAML
jgi:AraC-like DNA-binding protein